MAAPVREIAAALVTVLNNGPWDPALEATREYQRLDKLPDLTSRKVYVIPRQDETTAKVDRSRWTHTAIVDVAISQKVAEGDDTEKDAILDLADEVAEYLKANRPNLPAKLTGCTVQALWDPERLKNENIFTSAVTLTFEQHR
jgi:hypothetical protein